MGIVKSFEQFLLEMSFEWKLAKRKIENLQMSIAKHSRYLYLGILSNDKNTNHWKSELFNWLDDVNTIKTKPKNNKFDYSVYYEILFNQPLNNGMDNWIIDINNDIINKQINISLTNDQIKNMYYHMDIFFQRICNLIAYNRFNLNTFNVAIKEHFIL